jgi:hypothetical protein
VAAVTLTDWCAQPHRGYGARVCDDELFVWVGGNPYVFPAPPHASCTIPLSRLAFFWRNAVAGRLRMLRRSLSEG